jgi:hypothetical protein
MTMANWKDKIVRKKSKGSQTPGKLKGPKCQATGLDRLMAKRNRSYKSPEYTRWCQRKPGY